MCDLSFLLFHWWLSRRPLWQAGIWLEKRDGGCGLSTVTRLHISASVTQTSCRILAPPTIGAHLSCTWETRLDAHTQQHLPSYNHKNVSKFRSSHELIMISISQSPWARHFPSNPPLELLSGKQHKIVPSCEREANRNHSCKITLWKYLKDIFPSFYNIAT